MTLQDAIDNPRCWSATTHQGLMIRSFETGEVTFDRRLAVVALSEAVEPIDYGAEVTDAQVGERPKLPVARTA